MPAKKNSRLVEEEKSSSKKKNEFNSKSDKKAHTEQSTDSMQFSPNIISSNWNFDGLLLELWLLVIFTITKCNLNERKIMHRILKLKSEKNFMWNCIWHRNY